MSVPIIFIHKGYSDYMEFTLRQARYSNPNTEIILLGDRENNKFSFLQHANIKDNFNEANKFATVYKHYSTNPYNFELFCFQRWLVLKEFLEKKNYSSVLVFDTDIMIYSNINTFFEENNIKQKYDLGLCILQNKHINGCTSFWTTKRISDFCNFLIESYTIDKSVEKYKNVWQTLQKSGKPGGACDMTSLSFYYKKLDKNKILKLNDIISGNTFDENINASNCLDFNEYDLKNRIKNIKFNKENPICHNCKLKKNIIFNSLHFQGPAKYKVEKFYTAKNFKGIFKLKLKFKILSLLTSIYKNLPQNIQTFILNKLKK